MYWVDFTIIDPTAPTNRRIQNSHQLNSQNQSSTMHANRRAYLAKAQTYHRPDPKNPPKKNPHFGAVLVPVPFIVTCVGAFTPRDTLTTPAAFLTPKIHPAACSPGHPP